MNDEMKLRCLKGAKDLYHKAYYTYNDLSLEIETFNAAALLERAALSECECIPGRPVCPACVELAEILYRDNLFPIEGEI
jgi:hypothetical protein